MKKTNFAQLATVPRMSDIEYIEFLEGQIRKFDNQIEEFIQKMDKAVFSYEPLNILKTYTDNINLLRLNN